MKAMKEWQRTVLLLLLLAIAIGWIIWTSQSADSNLVGSRNNLWG